MCTGFIKKGKDIIYGFNMDMPDGLWDFKIYPEKDKFYIGIKYKGRVYKTHGVNANGQFGNMPYMNALDHGKYRRGKDFHRLDLLVNDYISGKINFNTIEDLCNESTIVNVPNCSMHSLFGDNKGNILLVEPGFNALKRLGNYAVISNFPILMDPESLDPKMMGWYGIDRYNKAEEMLKKSSDSFNLDDAMKVLESVSQDDIAPTKVSFVYSVNTNTVRYVINRDFKHINEYQLKK